MPVLLYHSVLPEPRGAFDVSVGQFAAHMAHLSEMGIRTLTVEQLAGRLAAGEKLPERTLAVTFDDACASYADHALPILLGNKVRSTLYVESAHVGGLGRDGVLRMSADAISDAVREGVSVGSHSRTHAQLDVLSNDDAWREISESRIELAELTDTEISSFAYPHGFFSSGTAAMVRRAGYSSAVAVKNAFSHGLDDPFAIARVTITVATDLESFKGICRGEGRPLAWKRERVRTRAWRLGRRIGRVADRA